MKQQSGHRKYPVIAVALSLIAHVVVVLILFWAGTRAKPPSQPVVVLLHRQDEIKPRDVARETVTPPKREAVPQPRKPSSSAPPLSPPVPQIHPRSESHDQTAASTTPAVKDIHVPGAQTKVDAQPTAPHEGRAEISGRLEPKEHSASQTGSRVTDARRGYLALLKNRIEQHREYPVSARKGQQEGSVLVAFSLSRDGSLLQARVARTSGIPLLDAAALRAVRGAGRFPPVPEVLEGSEVTFEVPIRFTLKDR